MRFTHGALGVVLGVASLPVMAALDPTAVVDELTGSQAGIAAIGAAALILLAGVAVFRYARRAI